jgi:hypothetical protein
LVAVKDPLWKNVQHRRLLAVKYRWLKHFFAVVGVNAFWKVSFLGLHIIFGPPINRCLIKKAVNIFVVEQALGV